VAASGQSFLGDRQKLADQRQISFSKPAIQRDKRGTVGIRQVTTPQLTVTTGGYPASNSIHFAQLRVLQAS
jgi:hypothetical protein